MRNKFEDLITVTEPDYNITIVLNEHGETKSIAYEDEKESFFDDCGQVTYDKHGRVTPYSDWNGEYLVNGKKLDDLIFEVINS